MSSSFSNDILSVKPTVTASKATSVFGDHRDHDRKEESQKYKGVEKIKDGSMYVGHVRENDDATKSMRKIYLGEFNRNETAAGAHDLVALKLQGSSAKTIFLESQYKRAREVMTDMTQREVVDTVKMLSFTFSKSISAYHRVFRDFSAGKWQACFGVGSSKAYSLGTFDTEEEAASAYDIESISLNGMNAITNFNIKCYNVDAILKGKTEGKVIYQSRDTAADIVEKIQPFQVLESIIGKGITTMLYGIEKREEEWEQDLEKPMKKEEEPNVALVSEDEDDFKAPFGQGE